jgi:ATP-dependent protease ClpP protease subunit
MSGEQGKEYGLVDEVITRRLVAPQGQKLTVT